MTALTSAESIARELATLGEELGGYSREAALDLVGYLETNNGPFTGSVPRQMAVAMLLAHGRGALNGMAHLTEAVHEP